MGWQQVLHEEELIKCIFSLGDNPLVQPYRNESVFLDISGRIERTLIRFLQRRGFVVGKHLRVDYPVQRRVALLHQHMIDLVLDVGANIGQYAQELRLNGYAGRIVSFEPLSTAYRDLLRASRSDALWAAKPYALGRSNGDSSIYVAGNSVSSSLLDMLPLHVDSAPQSQYVGSESIAMRRLDSLFPEIRGAAKNIWLKIDTQGYELEVLAGAETILHEVKVVQIELSLEPLYKDGPLFDAVYSALVAHGYVLRSIELGHCDAVSGRLLQIDGIFIRC